MEGSTASDPGAYSRIALIGETYDQVRDVMIFGESGLMSISPPDRMPKWISGARKLVWPNGAEAFCYSASSPEALRGPQFDAAWCDELAKWPNAQEAWDNLQFTLRLGAKPKQLITTTPRNQGLLKAILARKDCVVTHAPTSANRAYLADGFVEKVEAYYGGTRLGRQEINGELLDAIEGSLWPQEHSSALYGSVPDLDRIIVAVDPPVTGHAGSDECGIIVAGVSGDGLERRAFVLADESVRQASPDQWAAHVIQVAEKYQADRVVAEVNQGGDLVEVLLRQKAPDLPFKAVRATRGKVIRAEPIAALYEQGRVKHAKPFLALEDQMSQMTFHGFVGAGSPDRVDALVWALTELMSGNGILQVPRLRPL